MKKRIILAVAFAACLALYAAVWPQSKASAETPIALAQPAVTAAWPEVPEMPVIEEIIISEKSLMDEHWEAHSREMGLSATSNYGKDNLLIAMRDNLENLVSTSVWKLITESPETVEKILEHYDASDPELEQKVDAFLHNAVGTTMQVMDYPRLVQVMKEIPTYEDFNHYNRNNRPRIEFHRKWEHSRAKIKVTSLDEMEEAVDDEGEPLYSPVADESVNVEEQAFSELKVREFWASLNEDEQKLLQLKVDGLTTQEIASELGLKTHSAVVKRLQKLKKKYDDM